MKLTLYGIHGIPLGKRNIKDSRLDEANRLVEADKKTYAQADLIGDDQLGDADAILTTRESFPDLILKDLEFVETRLGRNPPEVERAALLKVSAALEAERCASASGLGAEEWQAVQAKNKYYHDRIFRGVVLAQINIPDFLDIKVTDSTNTKDEKRQLNALLRRLMLEFERREQKPS